MVWYYDQTQTECRREGERNESGKNMRVMVIGLRNIAQVTVLPSRTHVTVPEPLADLHWVSTALRRLHGRPLLIS